MSKDCVVWVLCEKLEAGEALAATLSRQGMAAQAFPDSEALLEAFRKGPCDLLLCEARLNGGSGLPLLAHLRSEFPLCLRVLLRNAPLPADAEKLINESGPCRVLSGGVNAAEIRRLLALESPVSGDLAAAAEARSENAKLKSLCMQIEAEKRALEKELERTRETLRRAVSPPAESPASDNPSPAPQPLLPGAAPEAEPARLAALLTHAMDALMASETAVLPVLPAVGREVRRLAADEDCSFEQLAETAGIEQGLSARLLQVANSPLYAGLHRIRNLHQAVARLGLRQTCNLLNSVLAENLFRLPAPALARVQARLWLHSLCVAHSNENIARSLQLPRSEDYFMLGLLHDVGKLVVLHLAIQAIESGACPPAALSEPLLAGIMAAHHHRFGLRLLQKWNYSPVFEEVVSLHNDDDGIHLRSEPVIVTYYSNLLARKIGCSLVPYEEDLLSNTRLAAALNMSPGRRHLLEEELLAMLDRIRGTYGLAL